MHTVGSIVDGALALLRARKQKFEAEHMLPILIEEIEDWIGYFEKIDVDIRTEQSVDDRNNDYDTSNDDDDDDDDDYSEEVQYDPVRVPADAATLLQPNLQNIRSVVREPRRDNGVSGFSSRLAAQPVVSTPHERANWWEGNEVAAPEEDEEAPGFDQQVSVVADSPAGFAVPVIDGAPIDTTPRFIQREEQAATDAARNPFLAPPMVADAIRASGGLMPTPPPAEGEATGFGAPSGGG